MTRTNLIHMIDEQMRSFFSTVEPQLNLAPGTLWQKWEENQKAVVPDKTKGAKKSNYQVFFSMQRDLIIKKQADITFGDISKQVSTMWKNMTTEEKAKYACEESSPVSTTTTATVTITTAKKPATAAKKPQKTTVVDAGDSSSVHIVQAAKKSARSKLELTVEEEKEEDVEEDFFFQEENSESEDASDGSDDIDDLGDIDECDENMYVDED